MDTQAKKSWRWLLAALALILVGMIGANCVQTGGGKVRVKDLRWETSLGRKMSALLFIPENATPDRPAPGIVTSHGWYNNREMQDLNYVEYSRRGYVVISIDMYGHGNSDPLPPGIEGPVAQGTGMYDAVELMATLPYVDKKRIGITGHSNGARACNLSIDEDNKKAAPLVSAVLLVANDATYRNPENQEYWNKYRNRDAGIIAGMYDEFFFRRDFADGTKSVPRTYIGTMDAQSFLHFGRDPYAQKLDKREAGTFYRETIDGTEAIRVIFTPDEIHPKNHFSKASVRAGVEFFNQALGAPAPLPPTNQVWRYKVFFNFLGLVGFAIFIVNFAILMLYTPLFAPLRAAERVAPAPAPVGAGKAWFWGGLAAASIFGMIVYFPCLALSRTPQTIFLQQPPLGIGLWSTACGVFAIVVMVASYLLYGKKQGFDSTAAGIVMPLRKWALTALLAILVAAASYSLVFLSEYFFTSDFRVWVLAVKAFTPDKLRIALPYFPLFLIYYIANSVSVNCFNHVKSKYGEWANTALLAFFNGLGPFLLVALQYGVFFKTGELYFARPASPEGPIGGIWLFPIIVILPAAAIISRKIYRYSNNPYLGGMVNGLLVTVISCTNTLTILPA